MPTFIRLLIPVLFIVFCAFQPSPQKRLPAGHLKMNLRFEGEVLKVDAKYSARVKEAGNSMLFLLNPGFEIQDISGPGLDTFQLAQRPGRPFPYWKLTFDRELKVDEAIELRFTYNIDLVNQNHLKSNWIELNTDKLWFPNYDDIDNEFSYEVNLTGLPEDFRLVGHMNAEIGSDKPGEIFIRETDPVKEVLILAGRDMRFWQGDSPSISFFAHKETPDSVLESMNYKVEKSIELMTRAFGQSDPIKEYRVVLRNTPRKELGFQFSRINMIITGPEFNTFGDLSHEVAHYWWKDADFINEPWMNESFANYSMFLVMEAFDPEDFEQLFEQYRKTALEAPPVGEATLFSDNAYNSYYIKGSVLLKKLEGMIGKEGMKKLLIARVAKQINTTDGFLMELEQATDRETRQRFEQMLQE